MRKATGFVILLPVSAVPDHPHPDEKEPYRNSRSLRPDWADEAAAFHILISLTYRHRHAPEHEATDHQLLLCGSSPRFRDLVKIFFAATQNQRVPKQNTCFPRSCFRRRTLICFFPYPSRVSASMAAEFGLYKIAAICLRQAGLCNVSASNSVVACFTAVIRLRNS